MHTYGVKLRRAYRSRAALRPERRRPVAWGGWNEDRERAPTSTSRLVFNEVDPHVIGLPGRGSLKRHVLEVLEGALDEVEERATAWLPKQLQGREAIGAGSRHLVIALLRIFSILRDCQTIDGRRNILDLARNRSRSPDESS
jgi:hypothetical protein